MLAAIGELDTGNIVCRLLQKRSGTFIHELHDSLNRYWPCVLA